MEPLSYYQDALRAGGLDPSPVDQLVSAIVSAKIQDRAALFAKLDAQANLLSWPCDRDYAAVALHVAARSVLDPDLRHHMLSVAMSRAAWCASCATSGSEGICRSAHVRELEALLPNSSSKADASGAA